MLERYAPEDPKEWLNRAHSNLNLARKELKDVYLEDLCFNAQQAVEKGIKAILIKHGVDFPFTHDIRELLILLQGTIHELPEFVKQSAILTRFAVFTRYPGISSPVVV